MPPSTWPTRPSQGGCSEMTVGVRKCGCGWVWMVAAQYHPLALATAAADDDDDDVVQHRHIGKYDAFETTFEVLRAMVDHPGTPPDKLASVDDDLRCG